MNTENWVMDLNWPSGTATMQTALMSSKLNAAEPTCNVHHMECELPTTWHQQFLIQQADSCLRPTLLTQSKTICFFQQLVRASNRCSVICNACTKWLLQ